MLLRCLFGGSWGILRRFVRLLGPLVSLLRRLGTVLRGSWSVSEGPPSERFGSLLEVFWDDSGILVEFKRDLESILEAMMPNIEKPSKTM